MNDVLSQLNQTYRISILIGIIVLFIIVISTFITFLVTTYKYEAFQSYDASIIVVAVLSIFAILLIIISPIPNNSTLDKQFIKLIIFTIFDVISIQYLFYRIIYILEKNTIRYMKKIFLTTDCKNMTSDFMEEHLYE